MVISINFVLVEGVAASLSLAFMRFERVLPGVDTSPARLRVGVADGVSLPTFLDLRARFSEASLRLSADLVVTIAVSSRSGLGQQLCLQSAVSE